MFEFHYLENIKCVYLCLVNEKIIVDSTKFLYDLCMIVTVWGKLV